MSRINDHLHGLPEDAERRLERLFAAFDSSWKQGARPRISDHLPMGPPAERRAALIELTLIDLEYATARDANARIEAYLAEFPELATDRDLVLDLADREFRLRRDHGEAPTVKEYVARFPDLAARLVFRLDKDDPKEGSDWDTRSMRPATPAPQVSLAAHDETVPVALPDTGPPRYLHIRTHARGGLGEVFTADDSVLHRKVALKRIRPEFAEDEAVRLRFFREAEITARLEHKGIAPIHEYLTDRLGQSWYVMRFVKGHTLRSAIERHHKARPGADPAGRPLEFRALLGRFIAVCETMAYAHRLGVVHRDLKPANVILGDYGETIVLDWGLATASGETDSMLDAGSIATSPSPLDESLMKSGKVFGTPAFMAPEQAGGHQTAVGPASDIYCLGAILYMILAGRPPITDRDVPTLMSKIQSGDYPSPRQARAEVPAALDAVCRKAMSLKPEDRYVDALALGRDLERWMGDEPVSVYREPASARLVRWANRHRGRIALAAAAALVATALGVGSAVAAAHRRAADVVAANRSLVEAQEIEGLDAKDPGRWPEAIALAKGAVGKLATAGASADAIRLAEDVLRRIERGDDDQRFVKDLYEARLLATHLDRDGRLAVGEKLKDYDRIFREHGVDLETISYKAAGAMIRGRDRIRLDLVAVLDDWAFDEVEKNRARQLSVIANEADTDEMSRAIREAILERDKAKLIELAEGLDKATAVPTRLHTIGSSLFKLHAPREAAIFLEGSLEVHPGDHLTLITLAQVHMDAEPPRLDEALTRLMSAESVKPNSPAGAINYGYCLLAAGRHEEAIRKFEKALKLNRDFAAGHYALGYAKTRVGKADEAIAEYRRTIELKPDFEGVHNAFVVACLDRGKLDEAIRFYSERIRARPNSAAMMVGLGIAHCQADDLAKAAGAYRAAIRLDPKHAPAHYNLGLVLLGDGRVEEAVEAQGHSVRLDRSSPLHHHGLGSALARSGKFPEALPELREAVRIKSDFALARWELGLCLEALGRFDDAFAEMSRAAKDDPRQIEESFGPVQPALAMAGRFKALQARLDAIVAGSDRPKDGDEALGVLRLCRGRKWHAAAARLWEEAFKEDSDFHVERSANNVLAAAHAAALAGTLRDKDTLPPGDADRADFRKRALSWTKDYVESLKQLLDMDPGQRSWIIPTLRERLADPDLACVRDVEALSALPEAERADWSELWGRVRELVPTSH